MLSIDGFKNEIAHNAVHHPDPSRKNLYIALHTHSLKTPELSAIVHKVIKQRDEIDDRHFANLITHAFEMFYIEGILEHTTQYWLFTVEDWIQSIETIMENMDHRNLVEDTLFNKKTQTNKYQRYLGAKALINIFYNNKKVDIIDGGCSLNLGLRGFATNKRFQAVEDNTSEKIINSFISKKINLKNGYGVDLSNPDQEEEWIIACNFYPNEIHGLPNFRQELKIYKKKEPENIHFILGDVTEIDKVWKTRNLPKVDILIENTILYQLNNFDRQKAIKSGKKLLKENGLYIVTDFSKPRYGKLSWDKQWFGNGPNYITSVFIKKDGKYTRALEFLKWKNARCKEAYEGKDYNKILQIAENF